MKQKYLILNDKKNKQIKIQEFAELNKQMLSLLCEEVYDYKTIKSAISVGRDELIAALRTNNMYPPGIYAVQIADAVIDLYKSKKQESVELIFDDINLLTKNLAPVKAAKQVEDEPAALDDLLEDDYAATAIARRRASLWPSQRPTRSKTCLGASARCSSTSSGGALGSASASVSQTSSCLLVRSASRSVCGLSKIT